MPVVAGGVAVPLRLLRVIVTAMVAAVVMSLLTIVSSGLEAAAAEPAEPLEAQRTEEDEGVEFDSDGDGVPDRPDRVSAGLLAAQLGEPVEDFSPRTESETSLINPDGTVTWRDFGGPEIRKILGL